MGPVVTFAGSKVLTARAGNRGASPSLAGTVRLFTSATPVTHTSVAGDFTEATFSGYARLAVDDDSWTPTTDDLPHAIAGNTGNPYGWTVGGTGQTVTGWLYVLDTGELVAGELYDDPHDLAPGALVQVVLTLTGAPEV